MRVNSCGGGGVLNVREMSGAKKVQSEYKYLLICVGLGVGRCEMLRCAMTSLPLSIDAHSHWSVSDGVSKYAGHLRLELTHLSIKPLHV